jgi:hypothetical protein
LHGKESPFDLSDPLIAAVRIPVVGPRAIGRFSTEAEARSAEVEFCKRIAEREQQEREQREQENARRRVEFTERVRVRRLKAEPAPLQPSGLAPVGIAYIRGESREAGGTARRSGSARRGPPSRLGSDDEEGDPSGSLELALGRPSSPDGGVR